MSSRPSTAPLCCYWLCCYSEKRRGEDGSPTDSAGSVDVVQADEADGSDSLLSVTSAVSALLSLVIVAVAVSSGQWLLTEEKLPRLLATNHNGQENASAEPDIKLTYSGLWRVCVALGSNMEYECSTIDYFPKEEYSPDPSDSTMAIPYAVTKSAVFFLAATLLLVVADVCYFAGLLAKPRPSLCVFVAGIVLIISGLLMLVGMVMYISVFKAEVGSKLRPRSSFQGAPAPLDCCSRISQSSSSFHVQKKQRKGFTFSLKNNVNNGNHNKEKSRVLIESGPPFVYRYGYSFLLYVSGFITTEFAGTTAIFLHISWQQIEFAREISKKRKYHSRDAYFLDNHHVHSATHANNVYRGGSGYHLCERHQKRYFYEDEPIDRHQHHHHHLEYDDYLPTPPGVGCNHYHSGMTHDLTTETVSTIADVMQDEYAVGTQHEFVTFDLGENLPPLPETVRNSGWKSNSFKKTTPV